MRTVVLAAALATAGCNLVFGLDAPGLVDGAAPPPGDGGPDASPGCTDPGGLPDEDGDLVRDACDNCPHRAQTTPAERADPDGDGIGVACDPDLFNADHVVAFHGFNVQVPELQLVLGDAGAARWEFDGGDLVLTSASQRTPYLAALSTALPEVTVEAEMTIPASLPALSNSSSRSVGVWANLDLGTPAPTPPGNLIEIFELRDGAGVSNQYAHLVDTTVGAGPGVTSAPSQLLFLPGERYRMKLTCAAGQCSTVVFHAEIVGFNTSNPSTTRAGGVGLRSYGMDARFHYLMVYAPGM